MHLIGQAYSVKGYPRFVFVIKSFNSGLQRSIPKTLSGVKNQVNGALKMVHDLTSLPGPMLGGFRIEVSARAKTLMEAKKLVEGTNYLNPGYWFGQHLGIPNIVHGRHDLTARLLRKRTSSPLLHGYIKGQILLGYLRETTTRYHHPCKSSLSWVS
jgi:hypothetical protein